MRGFFYIRNSKIHIPLFPFVLKYCTTPFMSTKHENKTLFVKEGRLRSFGRTSSRMSLAEQSELDTRLEPMSVPIERNDDGLATANSLDVDTLFKAPVTGLVVELGMGNGESIAIRSQKETDKHFIGCEVYKNGLTSLVREIETNDIQNLKVCDQDARDLLESLPENSVSELVVLYPDPWPKSRHKKRRIVNDELLEMADKVLTEDGVLFLATDIPDYMMWMLREVYNHDVFFPVATSPSEWAEAPYWWHRTKYERKAMKQGRNPWYMTFKRNVDKSNTKCDADTTQVSADNLD